jgi:hypothetical protein
MANRYTRKSKISKSKSRKRNNYSNNYNYNQKGGDLRIADTPKDFFIFINEEPKLDIETAKTLADYNINYYYSKIIESLPCSAAKLSNFHNAYDMYEYNFDEKFRKTNGPTKMDQEFISSYGLSDIITVIANYNGTYTIRAGSYFNYLSDKDFIKRLSLCENGAILISMRGSLLFDPGHALVLYLDHKNKKIDIIDSNGIDTDTYIPTTNLSTSKIPGMIAQILLGYTHEIKSNSSIFACQATTHDFTGSCMIWAKLFIELILRFGLDAAQAALLAEKTFLPIKSDEIALKYASYIHKCLGDPLYIIQDPNYIEAGKLRSLINSVDRFMITYKKPIKGEIGYIIVLPIKLSFYGFNPWKLEVLQYAVSRDEFNQQLLATLIKKNKGQFDILTNNLNEINTTFMANPQPESVKYVMYQPLIPERRGYVSS